MGIEKFIGDYEDVRSPGSRFRRRRFAPLLRTIEHLHADKGSVSILDIGGMEYYWNIVPAEELARLGVRITLLNLPDDVRPVRRPDIFTAVEGTGCGLPFDDRSFDISHSNSVIEHVFGWEAKKAFAQEAMRVADIWFHQTPNFWFPWEPHFGMPFFHWLPEPTRIAISRRLRLGWTPRSENIDQAMGVMEYATLLTRDQVEFLFPGAAVVTERLIGAPKSFLAMRGVAPA
jgi:hypothetical protein